MFKTANRTTDMRLPLPTATPKQRELYEILAGRRGSDGFHNATGMMLGPQSALCRIGDERQFSVVLDVGGELYNVGRIRSADPLIREQADQLTVFGPSPAEQRRLEARKKRAAMSAREKERDVEDMYRGWGLHVSRPRGEPTTSDAKPQSNAPRVSSLV